MFLVEVLRLQVLQHAETVRLCQFHLLMSQFVAQFQRTEEQVRREAQADQRFFIF